MPPIAPRMGGSHWDCDFGLGFRCFIGNKLYHGLLSGFRLKSDVRLNLIWYPKAMRIFCDFDGTISQIDVVDFLLNRLAGPSWNEIEAEWLRGEIGSKECLARQIPLIQGGWKAVEAGRRSRWSMLRRRVIQEHRNRSQRVQCRADVPERWRWSCVPRRRRPMVFRAER